MTPCPPAGPDVPHGSINSRPDESAEEAPMTKNPPPSDRGNPFLPRAKQREAFVHERSAQAPTRRTLRCRTVTEGQLRQLNYIRDLPPYALEGRLTPAEDDAIPTASEALLAALGSCLAVAIRANAVARVITIKTLELEVEADCDSSAAWGIVGADGPKPVGFEAVRVLVHIEADAPRDVLKTLVVNAMLWSPVGSTIHDPVHIDVVLA